MAGRPGAKRLTSGPNAGVYAVFGPNGVYIGESNDCFSRNDKATKLGIDWGIVREMPGSTIGQRKVAEREVADIWGSRGFAVVSKNTSLHYAAHQRAAVRAMVSQGRHWIHTPAGQVHLEGMQQRGVTGRARGKRGPKGPNRRTTQKGIRSMG